jgi:flagellar hook-associated protein 3 FlgL
MLSRIGTFSNANALMNASLKTQAQMADQQSQQASGYKSTTFGGLAGDAAKLLNLSGQSARLSADVAAATSAASQVQAAYSAATNIVDLATTVRSQLAAAISGASGSSGAAAVTGQTVSNWLGALQSELNTEVGGVYVFAGLASDQPPADFANPSYAPTDGSTPDTGYYVGSGSARTLNTSQRVSVAVSVTADASGFAKLANALSMMLANPSDPATLQAAFSAVGSATTDLGATQATLSGQAAALDTIIESGKDKATTLDNLATTLDGADLATATVKVTQYQSQLEALYSAISKLSQNSILKYL